MRVPSSLRRAATLAITVAALVGILAHRAAAGSDAARASVPPVDVELVAAATSVAPGGALRVGVRLVLAPGWHVYGRSAGQSGLPPSVRFTLPAGVRASVVLHPVGVRHVEAAIATYVLFDEAFLTATIDVPADFAAASLPVVADVSWLVCEEECQPGHATLRLDVPVTRGPASADLRTARWFLAADAFAPKPLPLGATARRVGADRVALHVRGEGPWLASQDVAVFLDEPDPWALAEEQSVGATADGPALLLPRNTKPGAPTATRVRGLLVGSSPASGPFAFEVDAPIEGNEDDAAWVGPVPPRRPLPSTAAPTRTPPEPERTSAPDAPAPPPATAGASPSGRSAPAPASPGGSLLATLLLAFVGGLLLNVMPCVLPILSVKALGFVEQAGERPAHVRAHGLVYAAGVLVAFWAVVALVLALRGAGRSVGWGFQLQSPTFVGICALLLFAMGLNLMGVFELGARLASVAGAADAGLKRGTWTGSFLSGVLATVIATPCTAPFMGPAVGWALAASTFDAFAVFTALGAGMALPFVLLLWFPALLRAVPRAGPWMETFRHVLAFPMFATALWLAWLFGRIAGAAGLSWLLVAVLSLALGAWAFGRYAGAHRRWAVRLALGVVLPLLALGGSATALVAGTQADPGAKPAPPAGWIPFTPTVVAEQRAAGAPVFLDFTADWCLTCKVNEKVVLSAPSVVAAFERLGYVRVMADWTRPDPDLERALAALGRSSIPVYVVYPADASRPHEILPTALTPGLVIEALERGAGR